MGSACSETSPAAAELLCGRPTPQGALRSRGCPVSEAWQFTVLGEALSPEVLGFQCGSPRSALGHCGPESLPPCPGPSCMDKPTEGPPGGQPSAGPALKRLTRAVLGPQVWAAGAGVAHSPPSTLVWKSQSSWGSGESSRTVLVNADGEEVAVQAVKQTSVEVSENGEEEEEEAEFGEEDLFHQQGDPRTTSRGCRLM